MQEHAALPLPHTLMQIPHKFVNINTYTNNSKLTQFNQMRVHWEDTDLQWQHLPCALSLAKDWQRVTLANIEFEALPVSTGN